MGAACSNLAFPYEFKMSDNHTTSLSSGMSMMNEDGNLSNYGGGGYDEKVKYKHDHHISLASATATFYEDGNSTARSTIHNNNPMDESRILHESTLLSSASSKFVHRTHTNTMTMMNITRINSHTNNLQNELYAGSGGTGSPNAESSPIMMTKVSPFRQASTPVHHLPPQPQHQHSPHSPLTTAHSSGASSPVPPNSDNPSSSPLKRPTSLPHHHTQQPHHHPHQYPRAPQSPTRNSITINSRPPMLPPWTVTHSTTNNNHTLSTLATTTTTDKRSTMSSSVMLQPFTPERGSERGGATAVMMSNEDTNFLSTPPLSLPILLLPGQIPTSSNESTHPLPLELQTQGLEIIDECSGGMASPSSSATHQHHLQQNMRFTPSPPPAVALLPQLSPSNASARKYLVQDQEERMRSRHHSGNVLRIDVNSSTTNTDSDEALVLGSAPTSILNDGTVVAPVCHHSSSAPILPTPPPQSLPAVSSSPYASPSCSPRSSTYRAFASSISSPTSSTSNSITPEQYTFFKSSIFHHLLSDEQLMEFMSIFRRETLSTTVEGTTLWKEGDVVITEDDVTASNKSTKKHLSSNESKFFLISSGTIGLFTKKPTNFPPQLNTNYLSAPGKMMMKDQVKSADGGRGKRQTKGWHEQQQRNHAVSLPSSPIAGSASTEEDEEQEEELDMPYLSPRHLNHAGNSNSQDDASLLTPLRKGEMQVALLTPGAFVGAEILLEATSESTANISAASASPTHTARSSPSSSGGHHQRTPSMSPKSRAILNASANANAGGSTLVAATPLTRFFTARTINTPTPSTSSSSSPPSQTILYSTTFSQLTTFFNSHPSLRLVFRIGLGMNMIHALRLESNVRQSAGLFTGGQNNVVSDIELKKLWSLGKVRVWKQGEVVYEELQQQQPNSRETTTSSLRFICTGSIESTHLGLSVPLSASGGIPVFDLSYAGHKYSAPSPTSASASSSTATANNQHHQDDEEMSEFDVREEMEKEEKMREYLENCNCSSHNCGVMVDASLPPHLRNPSSSSAAYCLPQQHPLPPLPSLAINDTSPSTSQLSSPSLTPLPLHHYTKRRLHHSDQLLPNSLGHILLNLPYHDTARVKSGHAIMWGCDGEIVRRWCMSGVMMNASSSSTSSLASLSSPSLPSTSPFLTTLLLNFDMLCPSPQLSSLLLTSPIFQQSFYHFLKEERAQEYLKFLVYVKRWRKMECWLVQMNDPTLPFDIDLHQHLHQIGTSIYNKFMHSTRAKYHLAIHQLTRRRVEWKLMKSAMVIATAAAATAAANGGSGSTIHSHHHLTSTLFRDCEHEVTDLLLYDNFVRFRTWDDGVRLKQVVQGIIYEGVEKGMKLRNGGQEEKMSVIGSPRASQPPLQSPRHPFASLLGLKSSATHTKHGSSQHQANPSRISTLTYWNGLNSFRGSSVSPVQTRQHHPIQSQTQQQQHHPQPSLLQSFRPSASYPEPSCSFAASSFRLPTKRRGASESLPPAAAVAIASNIIIAPARSIVNEQQYAGSSADGEWVSPQQSPRTKRTQQIAFQAIAVQQQHSQQQAPIILTTISSHSASTSSSPINPPRVRALSDSLRTTEEKVKEEKYIPSATANSKAREEKSSSPIVHLIPSLPKVTILPLINSSTSSSPHQSPRASIITEAQAVEELNLLLATKSKDRRQSGGDKNEVDVASSALSPLTTLATSTATTVTPISFLIPVNRRRSDGISSLTPLQISSSPPHTRAASAIIPAQQSITISAYRSNGRSQRHSLPVPGPFMSILSSAASFKQQQEQNQIASSFAGAEAVTPNSALRSPSQRVRFDFVDSKRNSAICANFDLDDVGVQPNDIIDAGLSSENAVLPFVLPTISLAAQ